VKIYSIALITLKDGLRNRVLYGVLLASLFLIIMSIFLSGLFMRDIMKVILDICLSAVSVGGLLVPFFIAITHLSGDLEKRTIYTLLSTPVSRNQYILGKYFGLSALAFIIMSILTIATLLSVYGATFLYPAYFFPSLPITQILVVSLLAFAANLMLTSCTMLWCTITTSSFLATLLTLSTYIVGQTVEDIVRFIAAKVEGVDISPVIAYATKVILYIFPNLGAFDFKQYAAHGLSLPVTETLLLFLYAAVYISIMLLLSTAMFKNRDLA
jgi:ABC-type transport system involved in multi-copper enzyme maturation permease subunit